jgi:hypothetical protein
VNLEGGLAFPLAFQIALDVLVKMLKGEGKGSVHEWRHIFRYTPTAATYGRLGFARAADIEDVATRNRPQVSFPH